MSILSEDIQAMRMWVYRRLAPSSICPSAVSRLIAFTSDTSMLTESTSTPSVWWSIASSERIGLPMSARSMSVDSVTGRASG